MSEHSFSIGDVVKVRPEYARSLAQQEATYTVVKINPRTIGCKNNATGGKLNADPGCLYLASDAPPADPNKAQPGESAPASLVTAMAPSIPVGTVVKTKRLRGVGPDELLVITGHVSDRRSYGVNYRLSRLGGVDGVRYFTGVPRDHLTPLSLEDVATALLDTL